MSLQTMTEIMNVNEMRPARGSFRFPSVTRRSRARTEGSVEILSPALAGSQYHRSKRCETASERSNSLRHSPAAELEIILSTYLGTAGWIQDWKFDGAAPGWRRGLPPITIDSR